MRNIKWLYLEQIYPVSTQTLQAFLDGGLDDSPGRVYALENAPLRGSHDPFWWNKWLFELTLGESWWSESTPKVVRSHKYYFCTPIMIGWKPNSRWVRWARRWQAKNLPWQEKAGRWWGRMNSVRKGKRRDIPCLINIQHTTRKE